MVSVGKHLVVELNDCDRKLISDCDFLKETLLAACTVAGATILSNSFHSFPPYGGVSGVVIIAESHFSVHTWPEYCYAAIDIFTCGDSLHPEKAVELLVRELQAKDHSILVLDRGIINSLVES